MTETKNVLEDMVSRFLCWKLPEDFYPDNGISFKRESDFEHPEFGRTKFEPIGTNLLNATQTREMLEYVAGPLLEDLKNKGEQIEHLKALLNTYKHFLEEAHQEIKELSDRKPAPGFVGQKIADAFKAIGITGAKK